MTRYLRASEITKKPVVTLGGEAVAQVKDIVFDSARGGIRCFTLSGRGLLSGPLKRPLRWKNVHALGPDAVMVRDASALEKDDDRAAAAPGGGDVLGARLMTEDGTDLGRITDVIIETGAAGETPQVVGYEIESTAEAGRSLLLPVIEPLSASGEFVVVPTITTEYTAGDLAGLPTATASLRHRLEQEA
jgi:sporulation protein YlmC with PRC-barrel domain